MNLILTSAARLRALYRRAGAQHALAAVARLVEARAARGVDSRLVLIEQGEPQLHVAPALVTPAQIAAQLAALASALQKSGDRLESLLIIGGPEIVPFHEAANPTTYDGDASVPNDCYYGPCNPHATLPDLPIGRIPGASGANPGLLLRLLDYAAQPPPAPRRATFGYATAIWQRSSANVYAEIDRAERLLLSPPTVAANLDLRGLDQARLIYCNLHGVLDGPAWYGQSESQPMLVAALRPADLADRDLRGAVVVSEACYGAAIAGRDERSAMALAFLARGVAGFVGPTAISYGPTAPPPGEADLIALHFLRALKRPGATLGAAFVAARAGMLRDTLARQATLDEDDQKTLLEFVLYGDPTCVVGVTPNRVPVAIGHENCAKRGASFVAFVSLVTLRVCLKRGGTGAARPARTLSFQTVSEVSLERDFMAKPNRSASDPIAAARDVARAEVARRWPELAGVEPSVAPRARCAPALVELERVGAASSRAPQTTPAPAEYTFTFASHTRTSDGYTMPPIARVTVDGRQRVVKATTSK